MQVLGAEAPHFASSIATNLPRESLDGQVQLEKRRPEVQLRVLRGFDLDSLEPAANVLDYDHAHVADPFLVRHVQSLRVRKVDAPVDVNY